MIERMSWLYWYDPIALVTRILSAIGLTEKMHIGLAELMDEPTEFWHSRSSSTSNITSSGRFQVS
jgi:hypothetical protein